MKINGMYVKYWEVLLGLIYICTFSAISVSGINLSDKIMLCLIGVIVGIKWFYKCIAILFKEYIWLFLWLLIGIISSVFANYPQTALLFTFNFVMQVMLLVAFTIIFAKYRLKYFGIFKFLYHISVLCGVTDASWSN